GIFARAWTRWRRCQVVALEPSEAMRSEMAGQLTDDVHIVAGSGEQLPLRTGSLDIAWLSAVMHHLRGLDACAAELRRVLTNDGVVLIRGLFADSEPPPGFRL